MYEMQTGAALLRCLLVFAIVTQLTMTICAMLLVGRVQRLIKTTAQQTKVLSAKGNR